jgi:hypothetical protein
MRERIAFGNTEKRTALLQNSKRAKMSSLFLVAGQIGNLPYTLVAVTKTIGLRLVSVNK